MKHPFKRTEEIHAELNTITKQLKANGLGVKHRDSLKEKFAELVAELRIQPVSVSI